MSYSRSGLSAPGLSAVLILLPLASGAQGQAAVSPADSSDLVEDARESQANFERFRESRIPVAAQTRQGGCDERIGRICIWFGGEGEEDFPPEPPETSVARNDMIGELSSISNRIRDPWVFGQLIHYMAESGGLGEAERVARGCDLADRWWCSALLGYVLHLDERFVEAEVAFREAAGGVPPEEEGRWRSPRFIFTNDGVEDFGRADAAERARLWDVFWRFSDPLFMREGNDRLTEHYARLVVARNREEAENPYSMQWGEDLEESLVRYGRQIGWSRVIRSPVGLGALGQNRSTVGHHHPRSRGYLFPEQFLEAPADIGPESWITTPREARAWYAAPYAPDFRGLETQVARFRRGDEMLVVGAYRPSPPERDPFADRTPVRAEPQRTNPFASRSGFGLPAEPSPQAEAATGVEGPVQAAFFLVPESAEGEVISVEGTDQQGVFTLRAPTGRYVSSMEVLEPEAQRAWRARQGVNQAPMIRGIVTLSDLMILREDAPLPADLDEAIPLARPNVRIRADERFTVAWEVYGLGVDQEVQVTLGFTEGRPGFLQRVGEFLGVVEPENPVEVTFGDAGSDQVETLFRAVALQLPNLDPGEYTLHLRLDLPGREPSINSRPIIVTP